MPPTRYQGYRDPYAGSIADIILRRGDIAARGAENIGQIQARAVETRGNAWAGAANTIASLAQGIPLQIERQREQAAVDRERQARTTAVEQQTQFEAEDRTAGQQAQQRVQELIRQHRTEDGDVDWPTVAAGVAAIDPDVATKFLALDKETKAERDAMRERMRKVASENALTSAKIAAQSTGADDFMARVDMFVAGGLMDEQAREGVMQRAQAAGEEGWPDLQKEIIAASPEFQAAQLKTRATEADIALKEADKEIKDATLAGTLPATQAQKETERHNKALETIGRMTVGQAAARAAETARHNKVMESQAEGGVTPNAALESTLRLRDRFVRETQSAQAVKTQYDLMKASLEAVKNDAAAPGSQGVLVTFQKILDPTSVVRESEYARSASGLSLLTRLEGQWMKIKEGGAGVPVEELQKFVDLSEQFVRNQARAAQVTKDQIDGIAREFGLKPENITRELGIVEDADGWIDLGNGVRARERQP